MPRETLFDRFATFPNISAYASDATSTREEGSLWVPGEVLGVESYC